MPALLTAAWNGLTLELEASAGPANQFGYFMVSGGVQAGAPVSQGLLCLAGTVGRYNAAAGGLLNSLGQFQGGTFVNLSGTAADGTGFDLPSSLPPPIGGTTQPGQTWHFQLWYRDGTSSNFSNGLSASF